jgi:hypothetical protein
MGGLYEGQMTGCDVFQMNLSVESEMKLMPGVSDSMSPFFLE